jgi:hypothetical protein
MIILFMTLLLISYLSCIAYVKQKMKEDSKNILEMIKNRVDKRNLENLIKLSEKAQNPEGYNNNIVQYQEEITLYTGIRAMSSPRETFEDFLALLNKLLTF